MGIIAHKIEKSVHQVSPQTALGLMSSDPEIHALENRDWQALFEALSSETQRAVSRPHLPAYNEISAQRYARDFEKITVVTATMLEDRYSQYPELENYMYSPYVKSKRFTQFQLETTSLVDAKGVLMNIFDMNGNGVNLTYDYQTMLHQSKAFMTFLKQHGIGITQRSGIIVPIDQTAVAHVEDKEGTIEGLKAHQTEWLSLLGVFGFATQPISYHGQLFKEQTLALTGDFLDGLSSEMIQQLLQDNFVFLDGEAILTLEKHHLLHLIHALNVKVIPNRSGHQSFEQLDGQIVSGINNPRISLLSHVGDYVKVEYSGKIHVDSKAYDRFEEPIGPATVHDEGFYILPIMRDPKYGWEAEYTDLREASLKQFCSDANLPVTFLKEMPNCKVVEAAGNQHRLLISNWSLDAINTLKIHVKTPIESNYVNIYSRSQAGEVQCEKVLLEKITVHDYQMKYVIEGLSVLYIEEISE